MKTVEFIKSVERLGFTAETTRELISIYRYDQMVASVSRMQEKEIDTRLRKYNELDHEKKRLLFHLLVVYANTPLEKREEPKKYYFRLKGAEHCLSPDYTYLNKHNDLTPTRYNISTKKELHTSKIQTKFAQEEIDAMPKELLESFDKIEVKND